LRSYSLSDAATLAKRGHVNLGVDPNLSAKPGAASRHPDEIRHTSRDLTEQVAIASHWGKLSSRARVSMRGRSTMTQTYSGGCQCGKVRYEVQMDIGEVLACNCSRCGRLGSLLAFAPAIQFSLLSGDADLTKFEFNKHMIEHQFCSTCGVQSFAIGTHPKTGAKMAAINVRCVDGIDVDALKVKKVDGKSL
jgi:hypothetical protein